MQLEHELLPQDEVFGETGATTWTVAPLSRSQILRTLTHGLLAALLTSAAVPLLAADRLLVRFSGLELPLDLEHLEAWAVQPKVNPELGPWLNLLDPQTRSDLQQILRQPLDLQGTTIPLLLESWADQ